MVRDTLLGFPSHTLPYRYYNLATLSAVFSSCFSRRFSVRTEAACKAAGCTWDKAKQVAKEYRQVLLIVAAGVSAALAATAVVFFFLGRKK